MYIKKVSYLDYRNIERAEIELSEGVNVLNGENAQGKTNILEGIYYFALGKSFRSATDKELIKIGSDFASVKMLFHDGKREREHEIRLFSAEKKVCLKEGIKISRISDFIGVFRAVLFSPEHLCIVKEGPSERRAFLDVAISQLYPAYMASLSKYKKLLIQRNTLLKDSECHGFYDVISVISAQMAREAAFISSHRKKYTDSLCRYVNMTVADMTAGREKISLKYLTEKSEEEYFKAFTQNLEKETAAKTTLYGIQKDDIEITLNGLDSRVYASQGQQRSIALAMKIAEGEIAKDIGGEYPVFLFDDILSELDRSRKDYVLSGLDGRQVIITGCEDIPKGRIFKISSGSVVN